MDLAVGLEHCGSEKRSAEVPEVERGTHGKFRRVRFGPRNFAPVSPQMPKKRASCERKQRGSKGVSSHGCLAQ
jgi:hypothetical protein